jgi:hypothetical protein
MLWRRVRCFVRGRLVAVAVGVLVDAAIAKRSSANSGVEAASGDAKQRKRTNCCVPHAQGESLKGVVPRSSGEVGIASGGWRHDALRPL